MKSVIEDKKLIQKKGRDFRNYEILEDGVLFEYKNEGNYLKYKIPFDDIEFNEIINNKKPNRNEVILFASVIINISLFLFILMDNQITQPLLSAILFGMLGSISLWASKILKKESIKFLEGKQNLSFFYSKDDEETVDNFIHLLQDAKKNHFRQKNLKIDECVPTEIQKSNFLWLYRSNQITKEEYEDLITQLDNLRIIKGD
ncbi:MAG: hypothetical protein KDD24_08065 [Flavobacteriales bacterium]|nr:hypothetical protein [Flavobacteriales bacterium]MCB9173223.1 hypothetical protein [Flavobacteriales bacterium]